MKEEIEDQLVKEDQLLVSIVVNKDICRRNVLSQEKKIMDQEGDKETTVVVVEKKIEMKNMMIRELEYKERKTAELD